MIYDISTMKFAVVTPFSRFENKALLIEHLEPFGITWHPLLCVEDKEWGREWIRPVICNISPNAFDICYAKVNIFLRRDLIEDDVYYSFLCDDDFYEPEFFDKIRAYGPKEQIIVASMKTGKDTYLLASQKNMTESHVGLEQMIIKGDLLKGLRFQEDHHSADGKFATKLVDSGVPIKYLEDVFVWFNYLKPGVWIKA